MFLHKRGTLILDESPDDVGGGSDTNASKDNQDVDTDDSTKNKSEKTTDGTSDSDSAKDKKKTETQTSTSKNDGKDDAKDDVEALDNDKDLKTNASAYVQKQFRKVRAINEGLQSKLSSLEEVDAENKQLKEELAKKEQIVINFKLAGEFGVDPEMLDGLKGGEEDKRAWLRKNLDPVDKSTGSKSDKGSDKTADKDDKTGDSAADKSADTDDANKDKGKTRVKDIDGNRPKAADKNSFSFTGLSIEEERERLRKKL